MPRRTGSRPDYGERLTWGAVTSRALALARILAAGVDLGQQEWAEVERMPPAVQRILRQMQEERLRSRYLPEWLVRAERLDPITPKQRSVLVSFLNDPDRFRPHPKTAKQFLRAREFLARRQQQSFPPEALRRMDETHPGDGSIPLAGEAFTIIPPGNVRNASAIRAAIANHVGVPPATLRRWESEWDKLDKEARFPSGVEYGDEELRWSSASRPKGRRRRPKAD